MATRFVTAEGRDVDAVAAEVDGRFISAFVRATKSKAQPFTASGRDHRGHACPGITAAVVALHSAIALDEAATIDRADYLRTMSRRLIERRLYNG